MATMKPTPNEREQTRALGKLRYARRLEVAHSELANDIASELEFEQMRQEALANTRTRQ